MAEKTVLGPNTAKEIERARKLIAPTTQGFDFALGISRGITGCWVKDEDGNKYFDAHSGPGVFNIGHRHPAIEEIKRETVFGYGSNEYPSHESNNLAEKLKSLSPGTFDKRIFFSSSGTESVEAAIRAAQIHRRSPIMMAFERAFHGRTSGARTLTDRAHVTRYSYPAFPVIRLPFPEEGTEMGEPGIFMSHIRRMLSTVNLNEVAALFWEPIQGEGGIRITSRPAFETLMDGVIRPNGILLVADEVQTFSRTGKWFASEHFGVSPDIICVAKALGGGAPIGATIMRENICWPKGGLYSNTWGGNPFCCACALTTLEVMEKEDLVNKATRLGDEFHREFYKVVRDNGIVKFVDEHPDIYPLPTFYNTSCDGLMFSSITSSGLGLMRRIEFLDKYDRPMPKLRDEVKEEAHRCHILLLSCGDSAIRVMPPLVISQYETRWLAKELAESVASAVKNFKPR